MSNLGSQSVADRSARDLPSGGLPDDHPSRDHPLRAAEWSALREGSIAKLRRRLAGDLDLITLKALRKEPQRRYVSVEQLAEDIRRHLEGLPVQAAPDSLGYRANKFVQRHAVGVAATIVILIAICGGVAATIREARIAAANERRAEQRFNDVRKLANSLMFEIHDSIRDLPGSTSARRLLVTRAQEYLDSLSTQSKGDPSLQRELAAAYERVGDVLGYPYAANLGDKPGALRNYEKARAIREALLPASPNDESLQRDLINIHFRLAQVFETSGNFPEALAALSKGQQIAHRLSENSSDPSLADYAAGGLYFSAEIQTRVGEWDLALQNYQRGAALREAAIKNSPQNLLLRSHLPADYAGVAQCLEHQGDFAHAIDYQVRSRAILDELTKSNPGNATLQEYLGEATNRLASYRKENGQFALALDTYREAHQIFTSLVAADPKNSLAKSNFGFSDAGIGDTLVAMHNLAPAIKVFRESVATFEEMSPATSGSRYIRTGLASAYSGLGEAYSEMAKGKNAAPTQRRQYWEEARNSCQKSLALWKDKEKRGELESGEKDAPSNAARCVGEAQLALAATRQSGRR
jgi:eukaryotic-like serine/threonine-protein kinase